MKRKIENLRARFVLWAMASVFSIEGGYLFRVHHWSTRYRDPSSDSHREVGYAYDIESLGWEGRFGCLKETS